MVVVGESVWKRRKARDPLIVASSRQASPWLLIVAMNRSINAYAAVATGTKVTPIPERFKLTFLGQS